MRSSRAMASSLMLEVMLARKRIDAAVAEPAVAADLVRAIQPTPGDPASTSAPLAMREQMLFP